jgi:hypothetical protein
MAYRIRIEGIYDLRTLKHLKQNMLRDFCFDFSPRSFNFVQEYVFLEQLLPEIGPSDRVFVHFARSNDPMVTKLVSDLKKAGFNLAQLYFEFDEWSKELRPDHFDYNYILQYSNELDINNSIGKNFCGFSFNFSFFEDLYGKNILTRFSTNFLTRFQPILRDSHFMILRMQWNSNIIASLMDLFEFNLISIPISSDIEICYRNVDLKKLTSEMTLLKKNKFLQQEF